MEQRLGEQHILWVAAFAVFAVVPLLKPGFFESDDMMAPVFRLVELDACLRDGVLFPRWFPDLYGGRGAPFFNYYAPLSYYAAEVFHLLSFGFINSVKAVYAASFILSGLFMYLYMKERAGGPGALVGAVLYMYAPYRFVDVYVRGSLAEASSFVLFPLILLALERSSRTSPGWYLPLLSLSYTALILTHNIMALVFTAFLLIYWMLFGGAHRTRTGLSLILGLGLSAFFWVPALLEKGLVQIERAVFNFGYVGLSQFFPSIQTFAEKQIGLNFQLGVFHLLALPLAVVLLRDRYSRFVMGALCLTIFFMTPYSDTLWRLLPLSEFVQFAWRLLSLAALLSSIIGGLVVHRLGMQNKHALALCFLVVLSTLNFIGLRGTLDVHEGELSPRVIRDLNTGLTYGGEYLPLGAGLLPVKGEGVEVLGGPTTISGVAEGCNAIEFHLHAQDTATVLIDEYYFPGWTAYVDGTKTKIERDEKGLILLEVGPGQHSVLIRLEDTPIRRTAKGLSLATLAALALLSVHSFLLKDPPGRQDTGGRGDAQ